jgi:hypothetical protein
VNWLHLWTLQVHYLEITQGRVLDLLTLTKQGEGRMDFVERLFGWAPDGGDGSFELMIIVGVVVAVVLGLLFRGRLFRSHGTRAE